MLAVKRAAMLKVVRKARRAMHPVDNAAYGIEPTAATSLRSGGKQRAANPAKKDVRPCICAQGRGRYHLGLRSCAWAAYGKRGLAHG